MKACLAERHVLWKEIQHGGYIIRIGHVSWIGMYFGSYFYKGTTGIFCVC